MKYDTDRDITIFITNINDTMEVAMEHSEMLLAVEHLKQENDRLHHLTTVLIDHIGKSSKKFPLKDIDKQMELYDKEHGT